MEAATQVTICLKSKDAADIVEQASGKSKRELEVLIAEQLPEQRPKTRQETVRVQKVSKPIPAPLFASARQQQKAVVKTFTVTLELSEDEMKLFEQAQKILSRKTLKEAVLGAAKKLVVGKQKLESTRNKRLLKIQGAAIVSKETSLEKFCYKKEKSLLDVPSRYIPADVRHAVEQRDQCQCTFVAADGRRCSETRNLQFDHVQPHALGGESTVTNLRLLCGAHNRLEAAKVFGEAAIRGLVQFKQKERLAGSSGSNPR
jgi:5-methylcytosine-specific restriction endonuclease McrA